MDDPVFVILGVGNIPDTDQNTLCYTMNGVRQPELTMRNALLAYHALKDVGSIEWAIIMGLVMQNPKRNTDISDIISKIETLSKVSTDIVPKPL